MSKKRLFLLDGSAIFYRSYFAFIRNPLINSKGENTSAVFGFANFLMKILFEEKPDYLAVVFDTKEPTFRHKMYDQYKATREKMPEDMVHQLPLTTELVKAFDVPWLDKAGYEADDIIGTLAKRAEVEGIETFMCTGDKDMMQLITPAIKMYSLKSTANAEIIDADTVMEDYGLRPDQIIDYLALMGDASDNVPGVPKVGKKTAQSLLQEYDSLDGVYKNLENITKNAVRQSLTDNKDLADLSRELVTIETKVPIEVSWEALSCGKVDTEKITEFFEQMEFSSLIERLGTQTGDEVERGPGSYSPETQDYRLVDTQAGLAELCDQLNNLDFFVFDTETTGLDTFASDVIGISVAWEENIAYYVPLNAEGEGKVSGDEVVAAMKPIFENLDIKKGGQNIKFDALMLWQHGIDLKGIYFDTLIAGFLVSPASRENNLDALAGNYLGYKMISIETLIGKKGKNQKTMEDAPIEEVSIYAGEDADITNRLRLMFEKKLPEIETEELFHSVEMPLVEVLLHMEREGVSLDADFLRDMSAAMGEDTEALRAEVFEMAGQDFNLNSPAQLGKILFDEMEIHKEMGKRTPKKTATGQYSTSEAVLLKYRAHPAVDKILEYRKLTKLKGTYLDALPELVSERSGRLHTSFSQTVAATGRLSSHDPNLQNIPIRGERGREIRKAFVPRNDDYTIVSADYSQIELRMMAHMSGDEGLSKAFASGEDIHSTTAAAVFGLDLNEVTEDHRRKAKAVNFGIIYGISRFGLASRLNIKVPEAEEIIQNYFARFGKVNEYMFNTINYAREHQYVKTILNRRRYLKDINSHNSSVREVAERVAINTTIQGSAADLIKLAMINIHNRIQKEGLKSRMLLQVHDELVFETLKSELDTVKSLVVHEMEHAMELSVPLRVDIGSGDNWLEAH